MDQEEQTAKAELQALSNYMRTASQVPQTPVDVNEPSLSQSLREPEEEEPIPLTQRKPLSPAQAAKPAQPSAVKRAKVFPKVPREEGVRD